jgi:hypothetical protein
VKSGVEISGLSILSLEKPKAAVGVILQTNSGAAFKIGRKALTLPGY